MATFFCPQGGRCRSSTVLGNNSLLLERLTVLAVLFFFPTTRNCRISAKEKERKKGKAEQGTEAGELCDKTFHLSPYIITEC